MVSASSLLVSAALLFGLRGGAAHNFLGKPTVVPEARVSNHSDAINAALAAEGRLLRKVDWDKLGGGIGAGVGAVTTSAEFAKDPSVASAASALTSIGSLAMLAPPPAGPVAGGVMMLVGGLMSVFGGGGEVVPSNDDILVAMRSGFANVNEKLDTIDKRLIAVQAQLTLIEAKLDLLLVAVEHVKVVLRDIQQDVEDIFEAVVLGLNDLDDIDAEFDVTMKRLRLAMRDPSLMREFSEKVVAQREALTKHAGPRGVLSPANLEKFLDLELRAENGKCAAAISYQMMMATRFKVFFIQFMGSVFSCPGCRRKNKVPKMTNATVEYAEDLKRDLLAYEQIVKAKGAMELAKLSPSQMAPGMRAPQYVYDDSLWLGADPVDNTDGHLWRDAALLPVFGTIPFECFDGSCISDTCTKIQRADLMKTLHDPTYKHHGTFGDAGRPGKTSVTVSPKDCDSEKVCRTAGGSSPINILNTPKAEPKPCKLCGPKQMPWEVQLEGEHEYEHRIQMVPWVGPNPNRHQCPPLDPRGGLLEYYRYARCIRDNGGPKQSCAVEVLTGRWGDWKKRGVTKSARMPLRTAQLGHVFLNKCFKAQPEFKFKQ